MRFKPSRQLRSHFPDATLDLPVADFDPGILKQVLAGFVVGVFGGGAIDHSAQGRGIGAFQRQGGVGRTMALLAVGVIIPEDMHRAKEAGDFEMSALDKALLGGGLKSSVKLIDQGLHHRLEQFARRLEYQLPEGPFEGQELLLGRRLI
jgi:hypothetical protein